MNFSFLKRCLVQLFQMGGVLVGATLLGRFALMIFYPGTRDTAWLFEALAPCWGLFMGASGLFVWPVEALGRLVATHLPPAIQVQFPISQAAAVFKALHVVPAGQSASHAYPGVLEWTTLLAAALWAAGFLTLSLGALLLPDGFGSDPATPSRPGSARRKSSTQAPSSSSSAPASSWTVADAERRLSARPGADAPQSPSRPSAPPAASPNVGIREMLNDLKRENISLQARQQEMKKTIGQYFSPNVLAYMEKHRHTFENIQNQRCQVSVLFCDIRGFTGFSQSHSPEEVRAYLSEYFNLANDIILNAHQGSINKLMGDGIMAYWGFPVPTTDHALLATQAALGILRELDMRNQCLKPGQSPMTVGLGVCSGEALIGNVGSSDFKDFTLIGNPVNLASRLEGMNKDLHTQLLISESTYQGLRGRLPCVDKGVVTVRGWDGPLRVYEPKR